MSQYFKGLNKTMNIYRDALIGRMHDMIDIGSNNSQFDDVKHEEQGYESIGIETKMA